MFSSVQHGYSRATGRRQLASTWLHRGMHTVTAGIHAVTAGIHTVAAEVHNVPTRRWVGRDRCEWMGGGGGGKGCVTHLVRGEEGGVARAAEALHGCGPQAEPGEPTLCGKQGQFWPASLSPPGQLAEAGREQAAFGRGGPTLRAAPGMAPSGAGQACSGQF